VQRSWAPRKWPMSVYGLKESDSVGSLFPVTRFGPFY
jgi:hypothetical protein